MVKNTQQEMKIERGGELIHLLHLSYINKDKMLVGSTMECWNQLACHTALVARHQKWHQTSIETDGTPSHSIKENLKRGKRLKKKQIALGATIRSKSTQSAT